MRLALFFSFVVTSLWAQQPLTQKTPGDSIPQKADTLRSAPRADTIKIKSYANKYDPRRALLLAAILPGVGQIYNRKYWKTPLVWGGFAILAGTAMEYQQEQVMYRSMLFDLLTKKANGIQSRQPPLYPEDVLRNLVNNAQRQRDLFIIFNGIWYLLQMVDAHVDAHLKEFKLNPELRLGYEPLIEQSPVTGKSAGLRLVLKF